MSAPGGRPVSFPRFAPSRSVRTRSWWAKAWQRAVEESAYSEGDLRRGRALARGGSVGAISVAPGRLLAAVVEGDEAWTVEVVVPELDDHARGALVDLVAAESGRVGALLAGDLPLPLAEQAEEAGAELLPYGGELAASCSCRAWVDPCPHALAVLVQAGWLVDGDPLVLLALRGLPRDALLADVHARGAAHTGPPGAEPEAGVDRDLDPDLELAADPDLAADLDLALDAALRAAAALEVLAEGSGPLDHLL